MSTPITTHVPSWDVPLTVHGAQRPSSADMLEIFRSHANRAQALYCALAQAWERLGPDTFSIHCQKIGVDPFHGVVVGFYSAAGVGATERFSLPSFTFLGAGDSLTKEVTCVCCNPAGVMVVGIDRSGGASSSKIETSDDGGATFTLRTLGASNTWTVRAITWTGLNFVAWTDDTSDTPWTAPDPTSTWTNRTNANTNPVTFAASDGNGTVVALSSASTNKAIRSTNHGATWAEVTLPANSTWDSVAYYQGAWFATDSSANYATSSDGGATWSTGTLDNDVPSGYPTNLTATDAAIFSHIGDYVAVSFDGLHWRSVAPLEGGVMVGGIVAIVSGTTMAATGQCVVSMAYEAADNFNLRSPLASMF